MESYRIHWRMPTSRTVGAFQGADGDSKLFLAPQSAPFYMCSPLDWSCYIYIYFLIVSWAIYIHLCAILINPYFIYIYIHVDVVKKKRSYMKIHEDIMKIYIKSYIDTIWSPIDIIWSPIDLVPAMVPLRGSLWGTDALALLWGPSLWSVRQRRVVATDLEEARA